MDNFSSHVSSVPTRRALLTIRTLLTLVYLCPDIVWGDTPSVSDIPDLDSLIPQTAADALVSTVGLSMDHRPYEPATGLGSGLNFGVEVSLVQPPSNLGSALASLSGSGDTSTTSSTIPFTPSVKLHFHKGITQRIDVGISILPTISAFPLIGGSILVGGDIKVVVFQPEEGPTIAVRASYNLNTLVVQQQGISLSINSGTITPQVLLSKKLDFADPYLGLAFQYTYGSVQATIPIPAQPAPAPAFPPITLTKSGSGLGMYCFLGLALRVPFIGLHLTLEGAYSPFGMNYIGTKIGFAF